MRSRFIKDLKVRLTGNGWTLWQLGSQSSKRVLITGSNSGIGFHAALELARRGAWVLMACRDTVRGTAAVARVLKEAPGSRVQLLQLDLASLSAVREVAKRCVADEQPLDILINNAGVMAPPTRRTTVDGFELQFGTNVVGHFLLTALLMPALSKAAAARVVTVASIAHKRGQLQFADLQFERNYNPMRSYAQSKLADLMFAIEMERRLRACGSPVMSVACHPGVASTNLFQSGHHGVAARAIRTLAGYAIGALLNTSEEGALPTLYAATATDVVGGGYYGPQGFLEMRGGDAGVAQIMPQARAEAAAALLWAECEKLTGVRFLGG